MACLELVCINLSCRYLMFDNVFYKSCPCCGSPMQAFDDDDLEASFMEDEDD